MASPEIQTEELTSIPRELGPRTTPSPLPKIEDLGVGIIKWFWKIRRGAATSFKLHYTVGAVISVGTFYESLDKNTLIALASLGSVLYSAIACQVVELGECLDNWQKVRAREGTIDNKDLFGELVDREGKAINKLLQGVKQRW